MTFQLRYADFTHVLKERHKPKVLWAGASRCVFDTKWVFFLMKNLTCKPRDNLDLQKINKILCVSKTSDDQSVITQQTLTNILCFSESG